MDRLQLGGDVCPCNQDYLHLPHAFQCLPNGYPGLFGYVVGVLFFTIDLFSDLQVQSRKLQLSYEQDDISC